MKDNQVFGSDAEWISSLGIGQLTFDARWQEPRMAGGSRQDELGNRPKQSYKKGCGYGMFALKMGWRSDKTKV